MYSILSLERDSDRERKIHNPNQQPRKSQEIFKVSGGSQKGEGGEAGTTPHHLPATYQVYTKGGAMGGAQYAGLKAHWPCLEGHAHNSAQLQTLFWSFSSWMSAPNTGGKREEEGKRKGGKERRAGWRERKGEGDRFSLFWGLTFSSPRPPPEPQACTYWYLLRGSCSLGGTYLCEHVLLPSYMAKSFPVFLHPLASPHPCH